MEHKLCSLTRSMFWTYFITTYIKYHVLIFFLLYLMKRKVIKIKICNNMVRIIALWKNVLNVYIYVIFMKFIILVAITCMHPIITNTYMYSTWKKYPIYTVCIYFFGINTFQYSLIFFNTEKKIFFNIV